MIEGLTLPATWGLSDLEDLERQCRAIGSAGDVNWAQELAEALLPMPGSYPGLNLASMKAAMAGALGAQKRLRLELAERSRFMVDHEHDNPVPMLILEVGGCRFANRDDEILFKIGRPAPR